MKSKFFIACLFTLISTSVWSQNPGSLDPTFDNDGIVTFAGTENKWLYSMVIQPDGKIIAIGQIQNTQRDIFIVRYNLDGSIDNSFNLDGSAFYGIGNSGTEKHSVALQDDGKILIAADNAQGSTQGTYIYRLNSDGSLDNSFGNNGLIVGDFGYGESTPPIKVQSDGKIIVAGLYDITPSKVRVVRLNSDGTSDSLFGSTGTVTINSRYIDALLILPDGKIIASVADSYSQVSIIRLNSDGTFDNSFDSDGQVAINNSDIMRGRALALQSDGKIIIGAEVSSNLNSFTLIRLNPDGTLDNSFDTDAFATYQLGTGANGVNSVTLQPDGKIVAAGFAENGINGDFGIIRLNQDGSIDNSFNSTGFVLTDIDSSSDDGGTSVAMQPDGKIVVAGYSGDNLAIARYLSGLNVGILETNKSSIATYIYPNPVSEEITFEYELSQPSEISLQLSDMSGKIIRTFFTANRNAGKQKETLQLNDVPAGNYLLLVKTDSAVTSVRLIKN